MEIFLELLYFPTSTRAQAVPNLIQTSLFQKFYFNGLFRTLTILSHRNTNKKCCFFKLVSKWSFFHHISEVTYCNTEDVHPRPSSQERLVITPDLHLNERLQKEWTQLRLERRIWPSQSSQTAPWVLITYYSNLVVIQKFPFNKSLALCGHVAIACPVVTVRNKSALGLWSHTSQTVVCALSQLTAYSCHEYVYH